MLLCKQLREIFFQYCDTKFIALHCNYMKMNAMVSGLELRSDLRYSVESFMMSVLTSESVDLIFSK
jgi:hypothetical protein